MAFFRLLIYIAAGIAIFYVIRRIINTTAKDEKCSRCDGRGFWYGTRGKEKCEWCRGSGRVPKGIN